MVNLELLESLKKVEIFSAFSEKSLLNLASITEERTIQARTVIFREGDAGDALYIVRKGKVTISKRNKLGFDVVIATLGDGSVLGDMALIDNSPRSATLTTVQSTTFYVIQDPEFKQLLYRNPEVTKSTMHLLCERLRRTNEKLIDYTLDNHPDMVILTDADFRITDLNKQAQKMLKIKPGEMSTTAMNAKLRILLDKAAERAHDRKPFFWVLLKPEKLFLWIHINPLKSQQGFLQGYLIELRDISQVRDQSRRGLEIASFVIHRLPDQIERLTRLAWSLSEDHPLRSESISAAHEVTRQLNKLVAFTELEAGPLRVSREHLNPDLLAGEVINAFQGMMAEKGCSLDCRLGFGDGTVRIDGEWIKKFFHVLLSNAIDYSPEGSTIMLHTMRTPAGRFRCRIQNPCERSISPDDAQRLFDIRRQLEEFESLDAEDFGLELPLVKHIVDAHDGTIVIETDRENLFSIVCEIG